MKYHLAEDTIDQKDIGKLIEWLKTSPRLTKDKVTLQFEEGWSRWEGVPYSVFCNSGSSANLLMYYVLLLSGRLKNLKVIVPSAGWVTSIAPAIQFGFEPIMCEADKDTFGLDLDHLEILLKKHEPSTVMMVQVLGIPHKMNELMALKKKYGFFLLEDACAANGARYKGKKVGTFGDMASFSAYFGHQFSTIEGGIVSTSDKEFYDLLVMSRAHGWGKDLDSTSHDRCLKKYNVDPYNSPFVFYHPGFNVRSTDLNAFLGLGQLEKIDWMISRRNENHLLYKELLGSSFYTQVCDPESLICSIHFAIVAESTEQRRKIVAALTENGVETRMYTAGNLGLHPFWFERYGKASFPVADRLHHCGLFLPNHQSLYEKDVRFIADVVLRSM